MRNFNNSAESLVEPNGSRTSNYHAFSNNADLLCWLFDCAKTIDGESGGTVRSNNHSISA